MKRCMSELSERCLRRFSSTRALTKQPSTHSLVFPLPSSFTSPSRPLPSLSQGRRILRPALAFASALALLTLAAVGSAATVVNPDDLRAQIVDVTSQGSLCPPGSVIAVLSGDNATVAFSQSASAVQTARCTLTFDLDVPEGVSMGMPVTILRGIAVGRTRLERRYAFNGAGASDAFLELPTQDFQIIETDPELQSRSCSGMRRVQYVVDVTAQLQSETSFFQLDSVDLDTTYRFGTHYHACDPDQPLVIAPGQDGEFCDGPQQRPCATGLICEPQPNPVEGLCVRP